MDVSTRCLSDVDLPHAADERWFDDYVPGAIYEFGHVSTTAEEIVAFARLYDDQPIHTDPEFATAGPFGGLIASGLQTMALVMRMYVDHYISHVGSLASPGLDEVRWPRPVRPGDLLRLRVTVEQARLSRSKPDRGLVHTRVEGINQDDAPVVGFVAMNFFAVRPKGLS